MKSPSVLVPIVAGAGLVFVWSAVHGANITGTLKDLLAGRPGTAPATDPALVSTSDGGTSGEGGSQEPGPSATLGQAAGIGAIKAIGQMQAAAYGWIGSQWTALDSLWTRESGWDPTATNPSSGAYGIAQFLDSTWATVGGTKTSDPTLQIQYGLRYIKQRYGSPAAAWQHELNAGWY